jgi:hypothetical protein
LLYCSAVVIRLYGRVSNQQNAYFIPPNLTACLWKACATCTPIV